MTRLGDESNLKYKFIAFDASGDVKDAQSSRQIRSHVRKSVLSSYKTRDIQENFRFYAPPLTPQNAPTTSPKKRAYPKVQAGTQEYLHFRRSLDLGPKICSPAHPYTPYICKHVALTSSRVDRLLKSVAFRRSAEPLFDPSHIDSDRGLTKNFAGCLNSPAFLNALMYSVIQAENHDRASERGLALKVKSIQHVSNAISSGNASAYISLIGAIMMLKAIAYRANDAPAHEAHSQGLVELLKVCQAQNKTVQASIGRAAYWLDLNGTLLMGSPRRLPDMQSPKGSWSRTGRLVQAESLPTGIAAHWDVIPDDLIMCYEDIIVLEGYVATESHVYGEIDDMQACIESRLAFLKRRCQDFGVPAEASRLAALICCYTCYAETWNNFLIPCRCASQLLDLLARSITDSVWIERRDLQLWLVLVGSCTAMLDQGHLESLKSSYEILIKKLDTMAPFWPQAQLNLRSALMNYIYPSTWFQRHKENLEWLRLVAHIDSYESLVAPSDRGLGQHFLSSEQYLKSSRCTGYFSS